MPSARVPFPTGTRAPLDFCWLHIIILFSNAVFFYIIHEIIIINEMKMLISYSLFNTTFDCFIIIC